MVIIFLEYIFYSVVHVYITLCIHSMPAAKVQIATLKGSLVDTHAFLVRLFSLMNPGVHTEIWYENCRFLAAGDCFDENGNFIGCVDVREFDAPRSDDWHIVDVDVTDIDLALQFVRSALNARVRYDINVYECALPKSFIDRIEADLDCCRPETWDHIFCSQFALLFLRWCDYHNILRAPRSSSFLLWTVNSRGCLPSRLQIITDMVFGCNAVRNVEYV